MTGERILKLAQKHIGEKYVFGALAPKDNPNWAGPWDCAEFASWLVFQASGQLYGCLKNDVAPSVANAYSGAWVENARRLGKIVSFDEAARTQGAFVLRAPQAGLIGHVVVIDGRGGTVEAYSTKKGVIRYTLAGRRWEFGVLPPMIQYAQGPLIPAVADPAVMILRLTEPNIKDAAVRAVQRRLKELGFHPGPIDGEFGPMTARAVAAYQLSKGLLADGEVGPATSRSLGVKLMPRKTGSDLAAPSPGSI